MCNDTDIPGCSAKNMKFYISEKFPLFSAKHHVEELCEKEMTGNCCIEHPVVPLHLLIEFQCQVMCRSVQNCAEVET